MATTLTRRWKLAGIGVALGIAGLLTIGSGLHAQSRRGSGFGGPGMGRMGGPGGAAGFGNPADLMRRLRALDITDTHGSEVFSICAGAALYRRSCLKSVGLFDNNFFAYLEDVDWGLRARIRGFSFGYVPSAEILHHGHAAGLKQAAYVRLVARNRLLLFLKNIPTRLLWRHAMSLCLRSPWT